MRRSPCLLLALAAGCAGDPAGLDRAHTRGLDRADAYVGAVAPDTRRAPATIAGEPVTWAELVPLLAEAAGGTALREIALDRAIDRECARRGLDPDELAAPAAVARERRLLTQALEQGGLTLDEDESARVINELRTRRGLGEARFARTLRRSAILRALVQGELEITDNALRALHDLRHGPRREIRLIVTPSLAQSRAARTRLERGADFSKLALEVSQDPSARTGGVVAPLTRADPSWPAALREAVFQGAIGSLVGPIAVETGYTLAIVDAEDQSAQVRFEAVRPELEALLRLREERRAMDALARQLLGATDVEVLDPALRWSWQAPGP